MKILSWGIFEELLSSLECHEVHVADNQLPLTEQDPLDSQNWHIHNLHTNWKDQQSWYCCRSSLGCAHRYNTVSHLLGTPKGTAGLTLLLSFASSTLGHSGMMKVVTSHHAKGTPTWSKVSFKTHKSDLAMTTGTSWQQRVQQNMPVRNWVKETITSCFKTDWASKLMLWNIRLPTFVHYFHCTMLVS